MRHVFPILTFLLLFVATGSLFALAPEGYLRLWADEFDGSHYDTNRWHPRLGISKESEQKPEVIRVANGTLRLAQIKNTRDTPPFMGGGLISSQTQGFGYYETRVRMGGRGWHEAFWTTWMSNMGIKTVDSNATAKGRVEIDCFEHYGSHDMHTVSFGVIQWAPIQGSLAREYKTVSNDLTGGFHTFGFEYQKDFIRFYFEDRAMGLYDLRGKPSHPFYLWLTSIATSKDAELGGEALFDYCRAYTLAPEHLAKRNSEAMVELERNGQGRGKTRSAGVDLWIEAEDFPRLGGWSIMLDAGSTCLRAHGGPKTLKKEADRRAETRLFLPDAAPWTLWARTRDFDKESGTRTCRIEVAGNLCTAELGRHGLNGWAWEKVGVYNLSKGLVTLALVDEKTWYARVDRLLLTTDSSFAPDGIGGEANVEHDPVQYGN